MYKFIMIALNNKEILQKYVDGYSIRNLAKQYDVDRDVIKLILVKNKIPIRTVLPHKIVYNEDFFKTCTNQLYYFWGFMLGDGSLTKDKFLTITLNIKDICILRNFCDWLKIDYSNIKLYKNETICRLNIYSNYLKNDLSKFGIIHNKTYNAIIPSIEKEYIKPFLLGLLDADGHITFNPKGIYEIDIVGHPLIMDWFESQIILLGYSGNIQYAYPKEIWKRIRIRRKDDVINLSKLLTVENYHNIILQRKWGNIIDFFCGKLLLNPRRLNIDTANEIKALLKSNTLTATKIANLCNVCVNTVYNIQRSMTTG